LQNTEKVKNFINMVYGFILEYLAFHFTQESNILNSHIQKYFLNC